VRARQDPASAPRRNSRSGEPCAIDGCNPHLPVGSMLRPLAAGFFCQPRALFFRTLVEITEINTTLNTLFFFLFKTKNQIHGNSQITRNPSVRRLRARSLGKHVFVFIVQPGGPAAKKVSVCVSVFCQSSFSHSWHFCKGGLPKDTNRWEAFFRCFSWACHQTDIIIFRGTKKGDRLLFLWQSERDGRGNDPMFPHVKMYYRLSAAALPGSNG
jgi:hypothetical protein